MDFIIMKKHPEQRNRRISIKMLLTNIIKTLDGQISRQPISS